MRKGNPSDTIDTEVIEELTFFQKLKRIPSRISNFVKNNPALTAAILGIMIVATIFTGGAILAAPAAFFTMAMIGTCLGALAVGCSIGGLAGKCEPWLGFALGIATFIGTGALISLSPIAGVVVCGLAVVTAGAALFAGIGAWISSCFSKKNSPKINPTASPSNVTSSTIGHSYHLLPPSLSPKASVGSPKVTTISSEKKADPSNIAPVTFTEEPKAQFESRSALMAPYKSVSTPKIY